METRYSNFNYLGETSLFSLPTFPFPFSFLPVDTHSISISALAGSGSISLRVWEGRPWDTEIPLAGKPVVMLSSAALGSIRMKEMSSHIPKILSICLFRCQVPGIYYVSLGQVLGFRKRLMGYVMSML